MLCWVSGTSLAETNIRAQRSFASVTQLGSWMELMTGAAELDGERGGVLSPPEHLFFLSKGGPALCGRGI